MFEDIILVLESRTDLTPRQQFACRLGAKQQAKLVGLNVHELDLSAIGTVNSTYLNLVAVRKAQDLARKKAADAQDLF